MLIFFSKSIMLFFTNIPKTYSILKKKNRFISKYEYLYIKNKLNQFIFYIPCTLTITLKIYFFKNLNQFKNPYTILKLINKNKFYNTKFLFFFYKWKKKFFFEKTGKLLKIRIRGVGWRYWIKKLWKKKVFQYLILRVGHTFLLKFFYPFQIKLKRISFYFLNFFHWSKSFLKKNELLLTKARPTFRYKDVGIRVRDKQPTIYKVKKQN